MLATTTTSNNDDYYYLHYYTTQTEDIGKSEFVILKGSHVIMLATTMTDFLPIFSMQKDILRTSNMYSRTFCSDHCMAIQHNDRTMASEKNKYSSRRTRFFHSQSP